MGDESSSLSGSAGGSYGSNRRTSPNLKPFTQESLERLETRTSSVIRDYGFLPRRTPIVVDGGRLPTKYEPFPRYMYGRPLEEIDRFIFEEVSRQPSKWMLYMSRPEVLILRGGRHIVTRWSC